MQGQSSDSKAHTKISTTQPLSGGIYSSPGEIPIIIIIVTVIPLVCTAVKLIKSSGIQGLCLHHVPSCKLQKCVPSRWINYKSAPFLPTCLKWSSSPEPQNTKNNFSNSSLSSPKDGTYTVAFQMQRGMLINCMQWMPQGIRVRFSY